MTISAADLASVREDVAEVDTSASDLTALDTMPQVLGYVVDCARHDGVDEADAVEIFVRLANIGPDELREHERVLRPLGYVAVCDRLREIAGRRKASLIPL